MNNYFSKEADRRISEMVIRYNLLDDGNVEKLGLENLITERTRILLYLIPLRNSFIAEEDLSGFFLDVMKDAARFITSYTISGTSYIAYLTEICRYRCLRYMRKKQKEASTEEAVLFSDTSIYERPHELMEPEYGYSASADPGYLELDLPALIKAMIAGRGKSYAPLREGESRLAEALGERLWRKRFMELLLYLPQSETRSTIAGLSRVLYIDGCIINRFFQLKAGYLAESSGNVSRLEELSSRYWVIAARIQHALPMETDPEKRAILEDSLKRAEELYRKRFSELRKARRGLSQSQIAELMGLPRSTVSFDLAKMRELLSSIASS